MTQFETTAVLATGDPRRQQLRRGALGTLIVALCFEVLTLAVKQDHVLYHHVPWQDDPYDAFVSFAVFFVPMIAAIELVRISLCRATQPLPVARAVGVLRGGRVLIATMLATVGAQWISVAVQAHRPLWNATTALIIGLLAVLTALVLGAARTHRRASLLLRDVPRGEHAVDWFTDLVIAAELYAGKLGPLKVLVTRVIGFLDRWFVQVIRHSPIVAAAAASLVFGVLLAFNTLLREGSSPAVWLDIVVGGCGMFAFLVAAGTYIGMVSTDHPAHGARRRVIDAVVVACAAVPVALASREWLWWIVGNDNGGAGRLGELLLIVALAAAVIVFSGETIVRVHHADR